MLFTHPIFLIFYFSAALDEFTIFYRQPDTLVDILTASIVYFIEFEFTIDGLAQLPPIAFPGIGDVVHQYPAPCAGSTRSSRPGSGIWREAVSD